MNDSMKDHFISGPTVDMESFATPPSDIGDDIVNIDKEGKELGDTYQYPCRPGHHWVRPHVHPKDKGVKITSGSLLSDAVMESL